MVTSYGDSPDLYDASSASCSADAGSTVTGSAGVADGTSSVCAARPPNAAQVSGCRPYADGLLFRADRSSGNQA